MLAVAGTTYAKPSGEVKASPLFHQSLDQTIARMEEPVKLAEAGAQLNPNMATQGICPMRPYTQVSTCSDTWCGTCTQATCQSTCASTCVSTCVNTCVNTCNQSTCTNTCAGVNCPIHYIWRGIVGFYYQGGGFRNDWIHVWGSIVPCDPPVPLQTPISVHFDGINPPGAPASSWNSNDGNFYTEQWYQSRITKTYYIRAEFVVRQIGLYNYYTDLHSLDPPDNSGRYQDPWFNF
jgi:hypothetical protein